ncbi:hypothetical protein ES288_A01G148200v1 [Gossypium darwinii]|uniref:Pre-mRNA-splicing factor SLU7 n=1 Tax=Gossypium darwinii TaxID=34276 RepID=A0A5D2HLI8_GOSDA|nr:hypothetical protein ES288_A01G148200v1 [Gossypium darwinii]
MAIASGGLAPAEFDEDGKEINPHIPQYISSAPWYFNAERPSLKHQRKWRSDPNYTKSWYDRGAKIFQAEKYRKEPARKLFAATSDNSWVMLANEIHVFFQTQCCGAMTHDAKSCIERPRKKLAKWTNMHIAPDEKIETFEQDYDGKCDTWNGYDASTDARVIERYEARVEARRKYLKKQQLKKLEEKNTKIDESKQMDFAKLAKRVRTTAGGSMGTVRNLCIWEDTAKYLLNLDVNSAYYDPKTRSMHEDPLPDADPNELYGEAFDKGQDIHMQAAPSQAELLFRNYKVIKEKYGNAELLLGQRRQVEYDRAGMIIKGIAT